VAIVSETQPSRCEMNICIECSENILLCFLLTHTAMLV